MASAVALAHNGAKTLDLLKTDPLIEKPFCVQLFGKCPDSMARAAQVAAAHGAGIIDLNYGCPARKVVSSGHGAALLTDFDLATAIAAKVVAAVKVPVTVKTRIAFSQGQPTVLDLGLRLEAVGVAAIVLHGRYGKQGFLGQADWEWVKRLADQVKIPVIGSGDVTTPEKAVELLRTSQAAAVMIGRAARGRPWLFRQCLEVLAGLEPSVPTLNERLAAALNHANWLIELKGPKAAFPLRTVLTWYVREMPKAAAFREAINHESRADKQLEILGQFFAAA
jgi:tRNA-dihydrouridine synthase B